MSGTVDRLIFILVYTFGMGVDDTTFGAIVVAGMTMLLGTKLLVGGMIDMLSLSNGSVGLLVGSVAVTVVVGLGLILATGGLITTLFWSRPLAILALAVLAVLGRPSLGAPEPVAVGQTAFALVTLLYLLFVNPLKRPERSNVDESESASRVGSTIR